MEDKYCNENIDFIIIMILPGAIKCSATVSKPRCIISAVLEIIKLNGWPSGLI